MASDSDASRRPDRWLQWCTRYRCQESRNIVQQARLQLATVVKAFEDKGLTETDALTNARLAKILTIDDYDTKRQEPKLWSPESTFEINSGTGLQDEND